MKEDSKATAFGGATKLFVAYDTTRDFLRQEGPHFDLCLHTKGTLLS